MMWKILAYEFEVNKDGSEFPEKVDSLSSALENMSSDKGLHAIYNLQIDDRVIDRNKIELRYEIVAKLNEKEILDLIEQEIKLKHNL